MNDLAGMEGKGLDRVYNRLVGTFDREPGPKSYMRYTAEVEKAQLRMGMTGLLSTSATTGRRVPGHTFNGYGHSPRG